MDGLAKATVPPATTSPAAAARPAITPPRQNRRRRADSVFFTKSPLVLIWLVRMVNRPAMSLAVRPNAGNGNYFGWENHPCSGRAQAQELWCYFGKPPGRKS